MAESGRREGQGLHFHGPTVSSDRQTWEALQSLSFHMLDNVIIYVDVTVSVRRKMCNVMDMNPWTSGLLFFRRAGVRMNGHESNVWPMRDQSARWAAFVVLCDTDPARGFDVLKTRPECKKMQECPLHERGGKGPVCGRLCGPLRKILSRRTFSSVAPKGPIKHPDQEQGACEELVRWRPTSRSAGAVRDFTIHGDEPVPRAYPTFLSMGIPRQNMLSWASGLRAKVSFLSFIRRVFIYRRPMTDAHVDSLSESVGRMMAFCRASPRPEERRIRH